jgi:hypothetical protein
MKSLSSLLFASATLSALFIQPAFANAETNSIWTNSKGLQTFLGTCVVSKDKDSAFRVTLSGQSSKQNSKLYSELRSSDGKVTSNILDGSLVKYAKNGQKGNAFAVEAIAVHPAGKSQVKSLAMRGSKGYVSKDALKGLSKFVIQVGKNAPAAKIGKTDLAGSFLEVAMSDDSYITYVCGKGDKKISYTAFNVFVAGNPTAIGQIGVQSDETKIFTSARVLTAADAKKEIELEEKKTSALTGRIPLPVPRPSSAPNAASTPATAPAPTLASAPAIASAPAMASSPSTDKSDSSNDTSSIEDHHKASAWVHISNTTSWTKAVLKVIDERIDDFEAAEDVDLFCPDYNSATHDQKRNCWLRMIGAMVKYESEFKTTDAFREPDGKWSVGLMALSPSECKNAPDVSTLKDSVPNLICGVNKMADLIVHAKNIAGPKGHRGAAAYWSTLKTPYVYFDKSRGRNLSLGKGDLVKEITQDYKSF